MKIFNNFESNYIKNKCHCKQINSLFEVECFLRKLSKIKNSICTANNVKHLKSWKNHR